VSSDSDLYQLLSPKVTIWNPIKKTIFNLKSFQDKYRISASMWADVKAIAGCNSDDIPGVKGVGDITAIKYLSGNLKTTHRLFDTIVAGIKLWRRNIQLTRLPFPGLDPIKLKRDRVSEKDWRSLMDELGMSSMVERVPGVRKRNYD
jgi:DNA polymerase-1